MICLWDPCEILVVCLWDACDLLTGTIVTKFVVMERKGTSFCSEWRLRPRKWVTCTCDLRNKRLNFTIYLYTWSSDDNPPTPTFLSVTAQLHVWKWPWRIDVCLYCITESIERRILGKSTIKLLFIHSFIHSYIHSIMLSRFCMWWWPAPAPSPTVEGMLLALNWNCYFHLVFVRSCCTHARGWRSCWTRPAPAPSPAKEAILISLKLKLLFPSLVFVSCCCTHAWGWRRVRVIARAEWAGCAKNDRKLLLMAWFLTILIWAHTLNIVV